MTPAEATLAIAAAVAGAALLGLTIGAWLGRRSARRGPTGRSAPSAAPQVVLTGAVAPRGIVRLAADVVVRAGPSAAGTAIEMDVPTQQVDRVLAAFRSAGLDVHDTGVTVDTDEGEETLTTIGLDLASLPHAPAPSDEDLLWIGGDLVVEAGARWSCHVRVDGDATLHDGAVCLGRLHVAGTLRIGHRCTFASADVDGSAHIGRAASFRRLRVRGDAFFADAAAADAGVVTAHRVHIDAGSHADGPAGSHAG